MRLIEANEVPITYENMLKDRYGSEAAIVTTMTFDPSDNSLIDTLAIYSQTQDVAAIDYLGHEYGANPPPRPNKRTAAHHRSVADFREQFQGSYHVLNKPRFPNFIGPNGSIRNRSHIKAYAVGNRVLSLGGVNCSADAYEFSDVMIDFVSEKYIQFLERFIEAEGNLRNTGFGESIAMPDQTAKNEIFVDYGNTKHSVILEQIEQELSSSDISAITFSSNYIPYGNVDRLLTQHQKNDTKVDIHVNHPKKFFKPGHGTFEGIVEYPLMAFARSKWQDNNAQRFNHLKAIVLERPDTSRVAFIGSHNFHALGSRAGTAEVCLRTEDPTLIDQLQSYIESNLQAAS